MLAPQGGFSPVGGAPLGAVSIERAMAHWRRLLLGVGAAAAFICFQAPAVDAASLQWDANGVLPVNGGTGAWNNVSALWYNGATFQPGTMRLSTTQSSAPAPEQ